MSAPLVVNTRDGACWTRRTVTAGGIALYAPEAVKTCPEFVMATLEDLAAHGIQGSADALPMPVGPEPQALSAERLSEITARETTATEGPWRVVEGHEIHQGAEFGDFAVFVAQTDPACGCVQSAADAEFVAHAREDVPALLTDNNRLRARVAELKTARKQTTAHVEHLAKTLVARTEDLIATEARVAELEALTAQATEFRLWEPGYGLYVRRAPGATGYGVMEARRTHAGRRVWTTSGWQYSAALSDAELFCWPDAQTAVAEARRIMPGATVSAEDVTPQVEKLRTLLAGQREQAAEAPHEGPQRHTYRLGRDLPEAGEPS